MDVATKNSRYVRVVESTRASQCQAFQPDVGRAVFVSASSVTARFANKAISGLSVCLFRVAALTALAGRIARVNPFDHRAAFLYDAKGGFLGLANYFGRCGYDDAMGLEGQYKGKSQLMSDWTKSARKSARAITQRGLDVMANNLGVIGQDAQDAQDARGRAEAALEEWHELTADHTDRTDGKSESVSSVKSVVPAFPKGRWR